MATVLEKIPELDIDLFAGASLRDPFADYRSLRDAGAVVKLARPDVYAIGRFSDVQAALRASDQLISGEGVGFSDTFNAPKGRNVLQTDGEVHRRMRAAVTKPLTPARLKGARGELKRLVTARVQTLLDIGWFDAMPRLASFLPVEAVAHLVGLPVGGRERMLDWAAAAFNVVGPNQHPDDVAKMQEAFGYISTLNAEVVADGSWASELLAAAQTGSLSTQEALAAISAYVIPSLDTTILAKGHLLHNLARHPAIAS